MGGENSLWQEPHLVITSTKESLIITFGPPQICDCEPQNNQTLRRKLSNYIGIRTRVTRVKDEGTSLSRQRR